MFTMTKLYTAVQTALANKKGAAMIEYALLAALIALVAAVGATTLGTNLSSVFTTISGKV